MNLNTKKSLNPFERKVKRIGNVAVFRKEAYKLFQRITVLYSAAENLHIDAPMRSELNDALHALHRLANVADGVVNTGWVLPMVPPFTSHEPESNINAE
jgi:hypothetical protein